MIISQRSAMRREQKIKPRLNQCQSHSRFVRHMKLITYRSMRQRAVWLKNPKVQSNRKSRDQKLNSTTQGTFNSCRTQSEKMNSSQSPLLTNRHSELCKRRSSAWKSPRATISYWSTVRMKLQSSATGESMHTVDLCATANSKFLIPGPSRSMMRMEIF